MSVKRTVIILVASAVAIAAGALVSNSKKTSKQQEIEAARKNFSAIQGNILAPARKIAIPELLKDDGSSFTSADLQGHWSIFFFGFTHCSEVCPLTMSMLSQAKNLAKKQGVAFPEVYLISIDPARDDIASLAKFVKGFDESFTGVSGSDQSIKALSLQMSVVYMRAEQASSDDYQVDHSSAILLLNPQGSLKAFLNAPHKPEKVLQDIVTVMNSEK